ncbi:FHA domain-containing protein [Clostridium sp. Marseille-Q2269]|uniref:FHA domain-containing protein n=1 Tax=Clostridium sp. Marseille-Q2269 TaxID=2942205 RepID=UPI0020749B3E|nr:FHA domain-containing protein [Clostridium sp. Marseille-Q2269]
MDLSKLSLIFKIVIIGIVYIIIFWALKIMYKDMKGGNRKRRPTGRRTFGLEIIHAINKSELRKGAVIPIRGDITIGRKPDNVLILDDPYVSGHHAKIYSKNTQHIIEDLNSTNGTLLNDKNITGKNQLSPGDLIKIGGTVFKVIG